MNESEWDKLIAADPRNQLRALLNSSRVGVVDGVEFDLQHPTIPPDDWHCPEGAEAVSIVFPSDRDEWDLANASPPGEDDVRWTQAEVGDRITIAELRRFDRHEGPLADRHDTEEWWATLQLVRAATGEAIALDVTLMFVPRDALAPYSSHIVLPDDDGWSAYVEQHEITFQKIGRRIERLGRSLKRREPAMWAMVNGVRGRITEAIIPLLPADTEIEHGWVVEAPHGPARVWLELADDANSFACEEALMHTEDAGNINDLTVLLDTVATAAYALARAEAELRIAPLAKRGLQAQASLQAATRKARERANPVRQAALDEISRAKGKISQTACAALVARKLKREQRAVERLIAPLFEWRDLPGGGREKRPVRDLDAPRQSDA